MSLQHIFVTNQNLMITSHSCAHDVIHVAHFVYDSHIQIPNSKMLNRIYTSIIKVKKSQ